MGFGFQLFFVFQLAPIFSSELHLTISADWSMTLK